jgi:hypothetical protein
MKAIQIAQHVAISTLFTKGIALSMARELKVTVIHNKNDVSKL